MNLPYHKPLDGVRAIAALMVMLFHFFFEFHSKTPLFGHLYKFAAIGQTGVTLFFVLSGFLITRILLATKDSPGYFRDFYIRRALRIFPLYYLFLIIYFFVVPVVKQLPFVPAGQQFYFWVYLQNFAMTFNWPAVGPRHYWSLAVEEHFYLLWPCLVYHLNTRGIKIAILVMLVGAFICRIILGQNGYEIFVFTFTRMDDIGIGALLAVWELEGKLKGSAKKFLCGLILVLIPTILLWVSFTGKSVFLMQVLKFNLISICYCCFVGFVIAVDQESRISKVLSGAFFSFTGRISYGLYIYHELCFGLLAEKFKAVPLYLLFVISFGVAYLVAFISFRFFESKFIELKKYFTYDRRLAKSYESS